MFAPLAFADGNADGGVVIYPSFSVQKISGTTAGDYLAIQTDMRVGYDTPGGLYLGMLFSHTSGGGANALTATAIGNSIGFIKGSWSVIGTFYLLANTTETSSTVGSIHRDQGMGEEIDIAYNFPIFSYMRLGPMLTWRSMSYQTQNINGNVTDTHNSQTFIYPFVGFLFSF